MVQAQNVLELGMSSSNFTFSAGGWVAGWPGWWVGGWPGGWVGVEIEVNANSAPN